MKLVAMDFETYYDRVFSLSKMTNEQYVMDDRFETILVSVWLPEWGQEVKVIWGTETEIAAQLVAMVPDIGERWVLAWNAKFDGSVLEWRVGVQAQGYICVMSMFGAFYGMGSAVSLAAGSRFFNLPPKGNEVTNMLGVHARDMSPQMKAAYAAYCTLDTKLCVTIYFLLLDAGFPEAELPLIDATDKGYLRSPLVLNTELAVSALIEERTRRAGILDGLVNTTQFPLLKDKTASESLETALRGAHFADMLRAEGVEPPMKISPSDPEKLTYAFAKTDEEFTDMRLDENPRVRALVDARLGIRSSIIETRLERLIDIDTRGTIPVPITYSGARVTNRWAASENESTNMQNLKRGSVLREVLCAPAGMKLVAVDLSAIELRVARWLVANWYSDPAAIDTIELIRSGGDVYCATASSAYGRVITKADKSERQGGKETELSSQFGVGAAKLNHRLRTAWGVYLEPGMDKVLVDTFRNKNKGGVVRAWKDLDIVLKEVMFTGDKTDKFWPFEIDGQMVYRPSGLHLWYPELQYEPGKYQPQAVYYKTKGRSKSKEFLWGGVLYANMVSSLSRDIMAYGWRLLLKGDPMFHPVMTVHDELISCVPDAYADKCAETMSACMTTLPSWARKAPVIQLPLAVEANVGQNYKECK